MKYSHNNRNMNKTDNYTCIAAFFIQLQYSVVALAVEQTLTEMETACC